MTVLFGCARLPQNGCHFLYVQRLKPNSLQKFSLEPQGPALQECQAPLSYSACYQEGYIRLLCLCKGPGPRGQHYMVLCILLFWGSILFDNPGLCCMCRFCL